MPTAAEKRCSKCRELKALDEFSRHKTGTYGRQSYCRPCLSAYRREYLSRPGNAERQRNAQRAWNRRNSARQLDRYRERMYGVSPEQVEMVLIEQAGRCAICAVPMRSPNVDHCHETGRFRGLLYKGCNSALGSLGDNEAGLLRALEYLRGGDAIAAR